MPGESSAVPTEDRGALNHLQTSPPTGPESVQHNPQEPVAAVEAQATWRVLLENRKLVTKGEDLRLQRCTGPKTGGYQSEKGDEKRAHYGSHHDLTNDRNPFVFRSDGVSGNHSRRRCPGRFAREQSSVTQQTDRGLRRAPCSSSPLKRRPEMRFPSGQRVPARSRIHRRLETSPDWIGGQPSGGKLYFGPQNLINNPPVNARLF